MEGLRERGAEDDPRRSHFRQHGHRRDEPCFRPCAGAGLFPSGDSTALASTALHHLDDRRVRKSQKKKRRNRRKAYREGTAANDHPSSRLQFSSEERAAPELQKAIRKSDKAADKLEAARAAVPEKQPSLHQPVNPLARPLQEIGHAAHAKVHEVERENVGVEAGHLTERGIEKAVRYGNRKLQNWQADRKLKPWREVSSAKQAAVQANADALYQKALRENPQLAASNLIPRMWQKKKLQKQYAAAYRVAHSAGDAAAAAQTAAKGAKKSADAAKKAGEFVSKHKKAFLIVGGIGLLLVMLLGLLQSCSSIFGGGVSNIVASSYLSEDSDLLAAEAAYCAMEDELREYLDTYEQTHDYDEYHFDLDEIKHDPYVLLSILSALHEGQFTIDQVQDAIFKCCTTSNISLPRRSPRRHATAQRRERTAMATSMKWTFRTRITSAPWSLKTSI